MGKWVSTDFIYHANELKCDQAGELVDAGLAARITDHRVRAVTWSKQRRQWWWPWLSPPGAKRKMKIICDLRRDKGHPVISLLLSVDSWRTRTDALLMTSDWHTDKYGLLGYAIICTVVDWWWTVQVSTYGVYYVSVLYMCAMKNHRRIVKSWVKVHLRQLSWSGQERMHMEMYLNDHARHVFNTPGRTN